MSTTSNPAIAASVPWALRSLADHITTHELPGPADINLPGTLIADTEIPTVLILLDERSTLKWIRSLDKAAEATITEHTGGAWYDLIGVANCVRVRLSWWVSGPYVDVCEGEDGTCRALVGDRDSIEPGCVHGRALCAVHRPECSQCVDDAHQDGVDR